MTRSGYTSDKLASPILTQASRHGLHPVSRISGVLKECLKRGVAINAGKNYTLASGNGSRVSQYPFDCYTLYTIFTINNLSVLCVTYALLLSPRLLVCLKELTLKVWLCVVYAAAFK